MSNANNPSGPLADLVIDFGDGSASVAPAAESPDFDPIAAHEAELEAAAKRTAAQAAEASLPKLVYTGSSPHSGHRLDTARRCLALYAYKHKLGVLDSSASDPNPYETRTPIVLGTLGHQALGLHYLRMQAVQQGEDPDEWATPEDGVRRVAAKRGPAWAAQVPKVLRGYYDYRRVYANEQLLIDGVEHVLDFEHLYGEKHTRSADLIPRRMFWDHKWVGRITAQTVQRYILDGQFRDYVIMAEHLWGPRDPTDPNCPNQGVWLNLCEWGKGDGTPSMAELRRRFRRLEIPAAPHATRRRKMQVIDTWNRLRDLEGTDPWTWPGADNEHSCQSYGMCEGLQLCRFGKAATRTEGDDDEGRFAVLP